MLDTVKKHVRSILRKLGACNRTHSVARARALGLLKSPDADDRDRRAAVRPDS